jgi:hypothetical protein
MGKTSNEQSRSQHFLQKLQPQFIKHESKYGSKRGARYGLGLLTIATVMASSYQALAQTATLEPTIPQEFESAFYSNGDTFFGNQSVGGTLSLIFGIPGFPENQLTRDGRNVNRLYREVLEQQVASDPTIRTPDLPNPFSGSLLTTPLIVAEEPIPPAPPPVIFQQPNFVPTPAPAPAPAAPARPVPALW